jgi:hypothetical protein
MADRFDYWIANAALKKHVGDMKRNDFESSIPVPESPSHYWRTRDYVLLKNSTIPDTWIEIFTRKYLGRWFKVGLGSFVKIVLGLTIIRMNVQYRQTLMGTTSREPKLSESRTGWLSLWVSSFLLPQLCYFSLSARLHRVLRFYWPSLPGSRW